VNNSNKLGWQLAAIATVVTLCGTSAFAEDRHRNGTRGGEARVARESDGNGRINRAPAPQQQVQPQAAAATRDAGTWRNADQNRSSDRGTQSRDTWQSRDRAQAESRNDSYNRGTRNDSSNRGTRNDSYNRGDRNDSSNRGMRNDSYNRGSRNDSYNRGSRNDSYNRGTRNDSYNRGTRNDSYNRGGSSSYGAHRGSPYYTRGRVSRLERYRGGYNIWVAGAPYPFFIPEARFRLFPFRVGIDISLGGFYNPLGYYDYYDGPAGVYSSGTMRGVVESVDYRRGTFVLRDDVSGDFVTLVMRGNEYRWDEMRPGDYVEVTGDWTRSGVFEAYRLDAIGDGYRR